MRVCVFEDPGVRYLDPLSLTRPAFDLLCGSCSLLDRQRRYFAAAEVAALVRPALAEVCQLAHPGLPVNDPAWPRGGPAVLVNARWLPPAGPAPDVSAPQVAFAAGQVAFVVPPPSVPPPDASHQASEVFKTSEAWWEGWLQRCLHSLPAREAGGTMIDYPWDLVEHNGAALRQDWHWRHAEQRHVAAPAGFTVVGPAEQVLVHPEARVEPFVVADTTRGPVYVDRGAVIESFSRLEGPCYVGEGAQVLGARLRGGTVGPGCRVGGEFEASIMQGHSNKYHDGFLGHSYVGEWVNLAAGTQVSDLRNDYAPVSLTVGGEKVVTELRKVGAFIGDHTKTGLNTLLNTGTVVGPFCQLLPTGTLLPREVPPFCRVWYGHLQERKDFRQMLATAAEVMERRGRAWCDAQAEFAISLYERTADLRRKVILQSEQRRLRRSYV